MSQALGPSREPGLPSALLGLIPEVGTDVEMTVIAGHRVLLLQREVQGAEHVKQDPVLLSRGTSVVTWLLQMCGHLWCGHPTPTLPLCRWDLSTEPRAEKFPQSLLPLGTVGITWGQRVAPSLTSAGTLEWSQSVPGRCGHWPCAAPTANFILNVGPPSTNQTHKPNSRNRMVSTRPSVGSASEWYCFRQ